MDKWLREQSLKRKPPSPVAAVNTEATEIVTGDVGADSDGSDVDDEYQPQREMRRYDVNYLSFGLSWCGEEKEPKPQCVICNEKLSNH